MTAQGENILALSDDDLCSATYPGRGPDFGMLCNELVEHDGTHRALAEIAFNYRRHIVWTQAGDLLPNQETSLADAQGQTPPTEGDQVT